MTGFQTQGQTPTPAPQDELLKKLLAFLRDSGYMNLDQLLANLLRTPKSNQDVNPGGIVGVDLIGGGNTGGGGYGCLMGDVLVRADDGTEVPASNISVDSRIQGIDWTTGHSPQVVTVVNSSRQPCVVVELENGTKIGASTTHKWFTDSGVIVHTPSLKVGDALLSEELKPLKIVAIDDVGPQIVHWWNCDPNHCYFAGGVLHHNATASQTKDPVLVPGAGYQPPTVGGSGGAG